MNNRHELTTEKVKFLYASYDDEEQASGHHDPITLTALSTVFKAERFLSEQYEVAAWNTVKHFVESGIVDKATMMRVAKVSHDNEQDADPVAFEVFSRYIDGGDVKSVIKRMILDEFSSVFSLEGFYASYGIV